MEHRASSSNLYFCLSFAIIVISLQDLPTFFISYSIVLFQVSLVLPLFLLSSGGFQTSAILFMSWSSLLRMCPIHRHFLRFISTFYLDFGRHFLCCRPDFLVGKVILSGPKIPIILRKHLFRKNCIFLFIYIPCFRTIQQYGFNTCVENSIRSIRLMQIITE